MRSGFLGWYLVATLCLLGSFPLVDAKWRFPRSPRRSAASQGQPECPADATWQDAVCANPSDGSAGQDNPMSKLLLLFQDMPDGHVLQRTWKAMESLIWYQPPVGIVTIWTVSRLLRKGRLFRWDKQGDASEQALSKKASRLDRHLGRALDLDLDDMEYQKFGGVERVRRRLLCNALQDVVVQTENPNEPTSETAQQLGQQGLPLVETLKELLEVSFPPSGSHADYVLQLLPLVASVEHLWDQQKRQINSETHPTMGLLEIGIQTAEIRVLDALLRLTRDRLLRSSFRLSRTAQHWRRRVQLQTGIWPMVRKVMAGSFEGDRIRLALAESAYQAEVQRLGKIIALLSQRPQAMPDSNLQLAAQRTLAQESTHHQPSSRWSLRHLPSVSSWAVRYNADGRRKFQVQTYDDSLSIGGQGARDVLLRDSKNEEWLQQAREWTQLARTNLFEILLDSLEFCTQATADQKEDLKLLQQSWLAKDCQNREEVLQSWNTIFLLVRDMHQLRRVGDGKSVKWKDANFVHWFRQWDLLGIPSALLHVALARLVHRTLLPYWPAIQTFWNESYLVTREIVQTRFWIPFRDLLAELMNRPTHKLLTGISLQDEESSLDHMLRDLHFGDGTSDTRHDAILKATRQYESDMNSGLVRHTLSGRLIRLILIQVQQLKVGMLHAADTVDVLLESNRLNLQLLAVVPAVVIVTVCTKIFFRFLLTLRHKDLRPMSSVHAEMTGYLDRLEAVLLLAKGQRSSIQGTTTVADVLTDQDLGEFAMTLYDYLVLLDYSSPQPFPNWQCDAIHESLVQFLGPQGTLSRMDVEDQVRLVQHVRQQHDELSKHL